MRISLFTLAMLVAMSSDLQILLWALALLPAAGTLMFVGFLLRPARRRRVQGDNARWRGVHRTRQTPGRHSPARGQRLQGVSRQAQLEERTVYVDAASILGSLERPQGQPDIGRYGFWSWDGGTVRGPRPKRPARAPETPPPGA
jgi:hypothetical protein